MYCFPQHLHDIKYITFLEVHFKMPLILYLRLVAKQVNSVEATKNLVQMSHLFWHFSEDHILTAANKKFVDLKLTRNGYLNELRNETSRENFQNICNNIKMQN